MKTFDEFEYKRPDIKIFETEFKKLFEEFENAVSAAAQYDILIKLYALRDDYATPANIAFARYRMNTLDNFYKEERKYYNNTGPVFSGLITDFYRTLLESKHRKELEQITGRKLFDIAEIETKTFKPEIIDDLRKINHLTMEYMNLISSAKINFEGRQWNLQGMQPFMGSDNRELRKNASIAKWKFFEDNEKEFDRIFDELVKLRTAIAKKLGYDNFVQLGYDNMGRTDYTSKDVAKFRDAVRKYVVPSAEKIIDAKKKRLGLKKLYNYDGGFNFKSGNPVPKGPSEWITEKAKLMYEELSPETGEFIRMMIDRNLTDLNNREGKSPGGFCSYFENYKSPFIFANMNGTAHDVRVFTHEAGHAFQKFIGRDFKISDYIRPTLEASEIFSMSMEFITLPWMKLFFEEDTDKFIYSHLCERITFIPYGTLVDEFQHFVYENHEASPDERKTAWREIEKKYMPYVDYDGNDFLERGGFWFPQHHIFQKPFYYVDYCLAEICALQFWRKFNQDRNTGWEDYMKICRAGGSVSFLELLKIGNLDSPFEETTIESILEYTNSRIMSLETEFDFVPLS